MLLKRLEAQAVVCLSSPELSEARYVGSRARLHRPWMWVEEFGRRRRHHQVELEVVSRS